MKTIISFIICICLFSCKNSNEKIELYSGKKWPYYYPTLEYKGGFYEIKKHYFNNYRTIVSPNNSGIVKIRFNINCKGISGNFHLETYSLEYKNTVISKKITDQLFFLTKSLNNWIPGRDEDGETVNSHKFLAFRIVNGKLIDILPK
ncbi:hypothetical protein [Tenacibaculum maritimum]|uniref:hypothetical protein n=1 Tax=Tenacibaculum maritimum TaxID=107401 RepID=UPI0004675127|nr:hypothetical protein [Tenacibaculum maritimum]